MYGATLSMFGSKLSGSRAADAVQLLRPDVAPGGDIQFPTANAGDRLRAVEPFLALAQRRLGLLQRGDVDPQPGDTAVLHAPVGREIRTAVRPLVLRARPRASRCCRSRSASHSASRPRASTAAALGDDTAHASLRNRTPGSRTSRGFGVDLAIGLVAHHQPILAHRRSRSLRKCCPPRRAAAFRLALPAPWPAPVPVRLRFAR